MSSKIVFFSFLFFVLSLASVSADVNGDDKELIQEYKKALVLFKNKEYEKSYKLFTTLFDKKVNDPNISFYLGRSAFELKKYDESIFAYNNVLFQKQDSIRTKIELSRAYILTDALEEAKKLLLDIKQTPKVSQNILKVVDIYLEVIEGKRKKHFISGVFIAGLEYDSNVNNRSDFEVYDQTYYTPELTNTTNDEGALAYQLIGVANYTYSINDKLKNNHDVVVFVKRMTSTKHYDKNIKLISYSPSLSVSYSDAMSVSYGVFIDNMWLDDANILKSYGFNPKILYQLNDKTALNLLLKYQIKDHRRLIDKPKNSVYEEIALDTTYIYSKKIITNIGLLYSKEEKKDISNEMIDNDSYTVRFGANYIYNDKLFISPLFSYKKTDYDDLHTIYQIKEKKDEYKFGVVGTYTYDAKNIIQVGVNYTKQKSNIQPDEYSKLLLTFNLIRPF